MKLYITLIIIIGIIALVSTILLGGKSDADYSKATRKNVTTLTFIYVVVILGALIALTIFIFV
ncbi:hypothetical protein SH601_03115 [Gracilibacillus sp. S3-1-1]|uniref:Uncharacterized protein n=1 Tax=Gracilibacillus pellucidus TaxID=3095368 RepID=A0ACC6M2K5_9BACI|nr:hypothetical protein [Gracilibacillus sp. S3-1-1]MDX8044967.1 hypothetical protein [Gracilibacillus sp. S3-1-1]